MYFFADMCLFFIYCVSILLYFTVHILIDYVLSSCGVSNVRSTGGWRLRFCSWFSISQGRLGCIWPFWMWWCMDLDSLLFPQGLWILLKQLLNLLVLSPGALSAGDSWSKCPSVPELRLKLLSARYSGTGARVRGKAQLILSVPSAGLGFSFALSFLQFLSFSGGSRDFSRNEKAGGLSTSSIWSNCAEIVHIVTMNALR